MSEVKTYSDIEKMVTGLMKSNIDLPKNIYLTVELEKGDFLKLQAELKKPFLTLPDDWKAEEISLITFTGIKVRVVKIELEKEPGIIAEARVYWNDGRKLKAIKTINQMTGGLEYAKEWCEKNFPPFKLKKS